LPTAQARRGTGRALPGRSREGLVDTVLHGVGFEARGKVEYMVFRPFHLTLSRMRN
jgi:hypothetical protein